jgi:hypothetical protein
MHTRPLPRGLSRVVQELDLRRSEVVALSLVGQVASEADLTDEAIAGRLVRLASQLPLRNRGPEGLRQGPGLPAVMAGVPGRSR